MLKNGALAGGLWLVVLVSPVAAEEWTEQPQGYAYQSPGLNCRITPDGRILELRWGEIPLAAEIRLRGDGRPADSDKNCVFWQHEAAEREPLAVRTEAGNVVEARQRLILGGGELPRAAAVELNYYLSPERLRLEVGAELLTPVRAQAQIFVLHARLDEATFSARGGRLCYPQTAPRLFLLPLAQTKPGGLNLTRWEEWRAVLPAGEVDFRVAGGGTRLQDDPGWGGRFSLLAFEAATWYSAPILQPAGRRFNWSLEIGVSPPAAR